MAIDRRKKYTTEFKQEAVRLITEEGYSMAETARNLDINANMLCRWKRESQEAEVFGGTNQLKEMKEELRRLRRENKTVSR